MQSVFKMCCRSNSLGHTGDLCVLWAASPFKWNADCKQNHISKLQTEQLSPYFSCVTFGEYLIKFQDWENFFVFWTVGRGMCGIWTSPPIGASTPKKYLQSKWVQMFSSEMYFIQLLLNFWIKYTLTYTCDILPLCTWHNCSPNAHTLPLKASSIWSSWGTVRSSVTICFDATNSSALA